MMDRATLTKTMEERELRIGEFLSSGYALLSNRFGSFLLLSVLVFLPVNAVVEYFSMQVDLTGIDLETADLTSLLPSLFRVMAANLGGTYLEMIAILVTAVIVKNQLYDPENFTFGTSFYRGIRMWPRAALTLTLVLIQMITAMMCCSMLMMLPILGMVSLVLVVVVAVRFIMYESFCGTASALRGRFGFDNLRYIRFLTRDRQAVYLGKFALIVLISDGLSIGIQLLCSNLFSISDDLWVQYGISVGLGTLLSILSIYGYVCGSVLFLNAEELRRKEMRKTAAESPDAMQREMAEKTLQAMDADWDGSGDDKNDRNGDGNA